MVRDGTLHEDLITMLVARLQPAVYLELGVHNNETMGKVWGHSRGRTRCIGVDIKEPYARIGGVEYYVPMDTDKFCAEVLPGLPKPGIVFIDADHKHESSLRDFDAVWPHMQDDGLVILHDTNPETVADTQPGLCGDSWRTARNISDSCIESVTLPFCPGLTIVRKRVKWGPVA